MPQVTPGARRQGSQSSATQEKVLHSSLEGHGLLSVKDEVDGQGGPAGKIPQKRKILINSKRMIVRCKKHNRKFK